MAIFTSKRERKLWLWVLLVVVTIYSTLGLAGSLAGKLRDENFLGAVFFFCFLMIVAVIIGIGLQRHPGKREVWAILGIVAVYGMTFFRIGSLEERTHLFEYGIVAILIHQALLERQGQGRNVRFPAIFAVVIAALLGWIDEGIQALLPNRVYDINDVGVNFISAFMAITASRVLRWSRKQFDDKRTREIKR